MIPFGIERSVHVSYIQAAAALSTNAQQSVLNDVEEQEEGHRSAFASSTKSKKTQNLNGPEERNDNLICGNSDEGYDDDSAQ